MLSLMTLMHSSQSKKVVLLSSSKLYTNMTRSLYGPILKFPWLNWRALEDGIAETTS
jgi:hypothetical protein